MGRSLLKAETGISIPLTVGNFRHFLLTLGMTKETRQIQLGNQIKLSSRSFRSIEDERAHDFHSEQFSC